MATFQASPVTSTFGNILYNPAQVDAQVQSMQQNALLMQGQRQQMARQADVDSREHVAQAAGYLLTVPPEQRPTAYKAVLDWSRANGHPLPNAPTEYPGDQYMHMLQSQGIPANEQYKMGMNRDALQAVDAAIGPSASSGSPAPAPSGGATNASVSVPPDLMPAFQEAAARTGIPVMTLAAQAQQESSMGKASGNVMQVTDATARDPGFGMTGVDPAVLRDPRANINFGADYLKARAGGGDMTNPAVRDAALKAYNGGGDPNYVANVSRYLPSQPTPVAAPAPSAPMADASPQATPQAAPSGPPAGPGAPQQMELLPNGLSRQQDALIRAARMAPNADPQKMLSDIAGMQAANRKMNLDAWTAAHPNIRATPVPGVRNGQVGEVMWQGDHEVGFVPAPTRPANAPYEIQKVDYERDAKELPAIADAGQQAQSAQVRLSQMRDLAQNISTGAAGNTRAAWANIAETAGFPEIAKALIASSANGDAAAAQEFAKMSLVTAGGQERSVLGARGGYQAIKLFKEANPNLDLRPEANRKILNMQLIGAQADADYASGALDFANHAGDAFRSDKGPYVPMSHFDQQWQAQRNPQIYAAAIAAINGDPWDKWTRGLKMDSPTDVKRVIDIVSRADPKAEVLWNNGQPHSVTP